MTGVPGHRWPALDGYRAIAALLVLTTHVAFMTGAIAWGWVGAALFRFDFGVALFFVLSGFLLSRPWVDAALDSRSGPSVRTYLRHRAVRILPAYWAVVVATLLLLPEIRPVDALTWLSLLLLLQTHIPGTLVEGLTQTWSLSTEVSFYLVLPFVGIALVAAGRRARGGRAIAIALGLGVLIPIAWRVLLRLPPLDGVSLAGFWLPGYLDWFAAGMALAVASAVVTRGGHRPDPADGRAAAIVRRSVRWAHTAAQDQVTCILAGALLFALACTPVAGPLRLGALTVWEETAKHWLYAGSAVMFMLPAVLGSPTGPVVRAMSAGWLRWLGLISYGIFLWHLFLLRLLFDVTGAPVFSGGFWWAWPVTVGLTVPAAWLSYRLIERPVADAVRRRTEQRRRDRQDDQAGDEQAQPVRG